eukprot:7386773-Prymnesium_polylepis.3
MHTPRRARAGPAPRGVLIRQFSQQLVRARMCNLLKPLTNVPFRLKLLDFFAFPINDSIIDYDRFTLNSQVRTSLRPARGRPSSVALEDGAVLEDAPHKRRGSPAHRGVSIATRRDAPPAVGRA